MQIEAKDLKEEIDGDTSTEILASLVKLMGGVSEERQAELIDHAIDMAASKSMEQNIVFLSQAMRMVGIDDDPMIHMAKLVGKMGELVLVNLLARMRDETPDEDLHKLVEYLNKYMGIQFTEGKSVVDLHKEIRRQFKEQVEEDGDSED